MTRASPVRSGCVLTVLSWGCSPADVEPTLHTHTVERRDQDWEPTAERASVYDDRYRLISNAATDGNDVLNWRFHYVGSCMVEGELNGETGFEVECDGFGDPVRITSETGTRTFAREYDAWGRSVRVTVDGPSFETFIEPSGWDGPHTETLEWDLSGRLIQRVRTNPDGEHVRTDVFVYDTQFPGWVARHESTQFENRTWVTNYERDDLGRLVRIGWGYDGTPYEMLLTWRGDTWTPDTRETRTPTETTGAFDRVTETWTCDDARPWERCEVEVLTEPFMGPTTWSYRIERWSPGRVVGPGGAPTFADPNVDWADVTSGVPNLADRSPG